MMSWDDLREASIDGVEFPVSARRILGGHDVGRSRPVGYAGQRTEPLGALPITVSIDVPLYASVDPSHYPGVYLALVEVLRDNERGGAVRYVDPVLGPMSAQVVSWSIDEEAKLRDGATISITLEERTDDGIDLSTRSQIVERSSAATAASLAIELDVGLADLGVLDTDVSAAFARAGYPLSGSELSADDGALLAGVVDGYIETLSEAEATIDVVRGVVDEARARVESLLSIPSVMAAEAWGTRRSLVLLYDTIAETGREVIGRFGIEVERTVDGSERTAHEIAEESLGDSSRWGEIVAANSTIRNPLRIGVGESLAVYVRPGGRT